MASLLPPLVDAASASRLQEHLAARESHAVFAGRLLVARVACRVVAKAQAAALERQPEAAAALYAKAHGWLAKLVEGAEPKELSRHRLVLEHYARCQYHLQMDEEANATLRLAVRVLVVLLLLLLVLLLLLLILLLMVLTVLVLLPAAVDVAVGGAPSQRGGRHAVVPAGRGLRCYGGREGDAGRGAADALARGEPPLELLLLLRLPLPGCWWSCSCCYYCCSGCCSCC